MTEQTMFARTKEATVWGILYGFQQEQIDFRISHVDPSTGEAETLLIRWAWRNAPALKPDHLACILTFNMMPREVLVEFKNVVGIEADGGIGIIFVVEVLPDPVVVPEVKKPHLQIVH